MNICDVHHIIHNQRCFGMSTEVNKCIFRGSNSAILNFAALVSRVQLLLKVHTLPLTPLWKGFCQPGKKEELQHRERDTTGPV